MREIVLFLCFIFVATTLFISCVVSGNPSFSSRITNEDKHAINSCSFTDEELQLLKSSTTIFLLRDQDLERKDEFEKAIKSAWDFNEIKVIPYSDINNYLSGNYSYFLLEGNSKHVTRREYGSDGSYKSSDKYDFAYYYLTLGFENLSLDLDDNSEEKVLKFGRIELFPDLETMEIGMDEDSENVIDQLYTGGRLKNWSPGYLKYYLKDVLTNLKMGKREYIFDSTLKKSDLQSIVNDTLYISEYILERFPMFTYQKGKKHDVDKLFSKFEYPFLVMNDEELSTKIVNNEVEYVFDYVKSCTDKFIRIYSTSKGKIYQKCYAKSYNLKAKDIKEMFESIVNE